MTSWPWVSGVRRVAEGGCIGYRLASRCGSDGNALLSAVRYELEKLRCSACGQVFTAPLPAEASPEKYSARARAVLALGRYYLGVPLYRLEGYQALVGVPVPDATQWDQIERVANCAYPVFKHLEKVAAQGEVIYQYAHVGADSLVDRIKPPYASPGQRRGMGHATHGDVYDGADRAGGRAADLFVLCGTPTCGREFGGTL